MENLTRLASSCYCLQFLLGLEFEELLATGSILPLLLFAVSRMEGIQCHRQKKVDLFTEHPQ